MNLSARSLRDPAVLFATWFGAGLLPRAPGTWGSLAALPFAWLITRYGGSAALLAATASVFLIGVWAAERAAKISGAADPGSIVIDEVAGQWLTLVLIEPSPIGYAAGFVAFRFFDIVKPWPVSWADRKIKGGFGIMLDDVLAAAYVLVLMLIYRSVVAR